MGETSDKVFYTGKITKEELSERLNDLLNKFLYELAKAKDDEDSIA